MPPSKKSIEESNAFVQLDKGFTIRIGSYPQHAPKSEFASSLGTFVVSNKGWLSQQSEVINVWQPSPRSEVIYTDERDMPSLEKLLAEHRVMSAVWERDASLAPVAVASGIAAFVAAVGITLLAVNISGTSGPDPLVSAFIVLAGISLIATVITALKTR